VRLTISRAVLQRTLRPKAYAAQHTRVAAPDGVRQPLSGGTRLTAIFLSHSSKDDAAAAELKQRLHEHGHCSLFLDFDPAKGIPAGSDWEKELYAQLRACRVVIILCSPSSMRSKWCFAEVSQARALGKPVVPVKVAACKVDSILARHQVVDLTVDPERGYSRLFAALEEEGLESGALFNWDHGRPPYPGLGAFTDKDAAVYFGRDAEIQQAFERSTLLRRFGGNRFIMVLGASGSGKSSFVRGGVIPRLARDPDKWLVVPPFRPLNDPLRELSAALAQAFCAAGTERTSADIYPRVRDAEDSGDALLDIARDLREATSCPDCTVMLVVDQFEETFISSDAAAAARFHRLLSSALKHPDLRLMALGTMRSDFLGELQTCPNIVDLSYESLELKPMSIGGLERVIEGPAEVAGLRLGDGLVRELLNETVTSDALPLLAFALRELYEYGKSDGLLELSEYREALGSLEESIARTAENVLAAHPLDEEHEDGVRRAFLALVNVNDEGQYVRRQAFWRDLPPESRDCLRRFVDPARLLVSHDGTLEVAHEALFRSWARLRGWLDEERDFLVWRRRLRNRISDWTNANRDPAELLRGAALSEAKRQLEENADLSADETAYVQASIDREDEEAATARRRSRVLRSVTVLAVVIALVSAFVLLQLGQADRQRTAMRLVSDAAQMLSGARAGGDVRALQQLLAADYLGATTAEPVANTRRDELKIIENPLGTDGRVVRVDDVALNSQGVIASRGGDQVIRLWDSGSGKQLQTIPLDAGQTPADPEIREWGVAFSPDGNLLAAGNGDQNSQLQLFNTDSAEKVGAPVQFDSGIIGVAFNDRGNRVAIGCLNGEVWVWDRTTGERIRLSGPQQTTNDQGAIEDLKVYSVAFSHDGNLLAAGDSGGVRMWDLRKPVEAKRQAENDHTALSVAFNPSGDSLAVGRVTGEIEILDPSTLKSRISVPSDRSRAVYSISYSARGDRIVSGSADSTVRVWDSTTLSPIGEPLEGHHGEVKSAIFNHDATRIVSGGVDGSVRVWDVLTGLPIATGQQRIRTVAFADNLVISGGADGTIRLWDPMSGSQIGPSLRQPSPLGDVPIVNALAVDGAGTKIFAGRDDGKIHVWDVTTRTARELPPNDIGPPDPASSKMVRKVVLSPDSSRIIAVGDDGVVRMWDAGNLNAVGAKRVSSEDGHSYRIFSAAFSADGSTFVTASGDADSTVQAWDTASFTPSGQPLEVSPGWNLHDVAFSPDATRIVTGGYDGSVRVWDLRTRSQLAQLSGDQNPVLSVAFAPKGEWVVAANTVGALRMWSADTYQPVGAPLLGHHGWVNAVAVKPDGSAFVSGGTDGMLHLWPAPSNLRVATCSKLSSNMAPSQWRHWISRLIPYAKMCPGLPVPSDNCGFAQGPFPWPIVPLVRCQPSSSRRRFRYLPWATARRRAPYGKISRMNILDELAKPAGGRSAPVGWAA
jgi:WD40 repeat protein